MKERISYPNVYKTQPVLAKSLLAIGEAVLASGLEISLYHLVKLRASQINGCAFCQHMHINEARRDGENQNRLDLLPVWRELSVYNERERAALEWTEALTLVSGNGISDAQFAAVSQVFSESEVINLTAVIVQINAWNRIGIGFNFVPELK